MQPLSMDKYPVCVPYYCAVCLFLISALMFADPVFADAVDDETSCRLSGAAPVVQGNVLFTPYADWITVYGEENILGGHVTAVRLYDPVDPGHTEKAVLWDAGLVLNGTDPNLRTIFFPQMTVTRITDATIAVGDGSNRVFSGTLEGPVVATTVRLGDPQETFQDMQPDVLIGDAGGKGSLDGFSGTFSVTFNQPPAIGVPVTCSYAHYTTGATLASFTPANVNNRVLALDDTCSVSGSHPYDLDGDGGITESDGDRLVQWMRGFQDGDHIKKDWLLGAVGQSAPAVAVAPGRPRWYYGTHVAEEDRKGYDAFLTANKDRRTVLYVGSRDGMLHAFDAGKFYWNDNPQTPVVEDRGYFEWRALTHNTTFNRSWNQWLTRYPDSPPGFRWQETNDGNMAPDYGTGRELWAFIPPHLLSRLKNNRLNADAPACVCGSPAIADVYVRDAWHTVLLCAEGNGGTRVFCLDITDPVRPAFFWESAVPGMAVGPFRSPSIPVGRLALGGKDRWAAFIGSGKSDDPDLDPSIYILDIADGSLIQRVFLHAARDTDGDQKDDGAGGVPGGAPAINDVDGNGYVDRMYVGTDKGFVFKVMVPDDPMLPENIIRHCVINTDFYYEDRDGATHFVPPDRQYQPLYHPPAVAVDHHTNASGETEYAVSLFFGTSDCPYQDGDTNTVRTQFDFFAYTDTNSKGECRFDRISLDWYRPLPQGHRAVAPPVVAGGTVYFGTATWETEDPCAPDSPGRIYALDMGDGEVIHEQEVGSIMTAPVVDDEHLYVKTSLFVGKDPVAMGAGRYNNDAVKGADAGNGIRAWKEIR